MTTLVTDPPASLLPPDFCHWCAAETSKQPQLDSSVAGSSTSAESDVRVVDITKSAFLAAKLAQENPKPTSAVDFSSRSVKELRDWCRQKGLKTTGKREELEQRLTEALQT